MAGESTGARASRPVWHPRKPAAKSGRLAHPWFVGVQFHPEFTSSPRTGHPLFIAYLEAALARAAQRDGVEAGRVKVA